MNRNDIDSNWKRHSGKTHEVESKQACMMEENVLARRVVLRGALAVGCGLLLPAIFSGCDSKNSAGSASSVPASQSATPSANSDAPASASKVTQASAQYQTMPKGEQQCSGCMNFIADSSSCKLVDGQISANGWCILWAKKA